MFYEGILLICVFIRLIVIFYICLFIITAKPKFFSLMLGLGLLVVGIIVLRGCRPLGIRLRMVGTGGGTCPEAFGTWRDRFW